VLEVASKQDTKCLLNKSKQGAGRCYSPYAVCAAQIGTTVGRSTCTPYYDFNSMPVIELKKYLELHQIPTPENISRSELLRIIRQKTQEE